MKIAINKCYGGFGLSNETHIKLIELGIPLYHKWEEIPGGNEPYILKEEGEKDYYSNFRDDDKRNHPLLIQAIEEVGEVESSGTFARIRVVDIPDDIEWEINEYDGIESIHEKHRSW